MHDYINKNRYSDEYNWLVESKSPYLRQHMTNPVNWYEWSDEAFEKANKENKPVFLSIGYSTCHWCHVMAHESFEDENTARILNERFISIKVDREERPDIDAIYMKVCQMLNQQGGWPLSLFLTPQQKPFFAGMYFPRKSRNGIPSFTDVITQLYDQYKENPDKILKASNQITEVLNTKEEVHQEQRLSGTDLHKTFKHLKKLFDDNYGGFGAAPKFPTPHMLTYLLRYHQWTGNEEALKMVEKTLHTMANGGIYDHIGYGFARYSTDEQWLVPHFEKMLYDNALLLTAYAEGYQVMKDERYKEISDQLLSFIQREMTDSTRGFYSGLDADTEGVEGKFYIWDYQEVLNILGPDLGELFNEVYNITPRGNFAGENIPNLIGTDMKKIATKHNLTITQLKDQMETAKKRLLQVREKRTYPHVDDKILTAWNSLMIAGLTKASRTFNNQAYLDLARQALTFIESELIIEGRIMVRYRDGQVKYKGYMDDYAFLLWAYLEMYETTFNLTYLTKAEEISEQMMTLFWDDEQGGFFFSGNDVDQLIARDKVIHDGAMPSGNGVAAVALQKLGSLTGNLDLLDQTSEMFATFKQEVEHHPNGHTFLLQGLIYQESSKKEVVILGEKEDIERQRLIQTIQESYLPHVSVLVAEGPEEFSGIAEFATNYQAINGQTTVYICENFACQQPTTDIDAAIHEILK